MTTISAKPRPDIQTRAPPALPKRYRPGGSCAECKRLKIKCAKGPQDAFPCESCVRRGCQSICPAGCLTAGKGSNRFVLANTEELHQKIIELSSRVRELEDALQELQATSSTEPHPLLRRELLLVKAPLESEAILGDGETASEPESLDAFGSLSIRGFGRSNFHAQTAGSWFFLQNEDPDVGGSQDSADDDALPTEILYASHTFPLGTLDDTRNDLRVRIQAFIPGRDVALHLVDNYFHGMAWMYDPIPRLQFNNTVFDAVYTVRFPIVRTCDMHALAVLFVVMAIGTLLDLEVPNYSPQATRFYQLARASLALDISLDEPSLATVQALHLMGFFLHMSDMKGGFGTSWALMGLNAKLAIGIGLHRDSAKWKLGGEDEIRQQLFWELYTYDTWQAMPCGRPPSFHRLTVDCKMPYTHLLTENAKLDEPGDAFKAWKHRFCYERLSPMVEQSFGPRTPSYATVLLLDRKIREDPVPPILQLSSTYTTPASLTEHENASLTMQRYAVLCVREISLLLMHRPFFAQAALEKAPLEAKFAPSVLAVYRSSCSIIAGVRALYDQQPRLSPRVWFFWAHIFSATICLGGLVARCPSLSLASSALAQVDSACELFSKITDSNRVSKSLPSMLKLREKARQALINVRAGQKPPLVEAGKQDSELSALVGETRLVSHCTQLPSPAQSAYGNVPLPEGPSTSQAPPPPTFLNITPQHPLPIQMYVDPLHGSSYQKYPELMYQRQYPLQQIYSDFPGQPEQPPQPSVRYAQLQDEYYGLPQYAHPNAELPASVQQGAWHNFMSQLEMDFT